MDSDNPMEKSNHKEADTRIVVHAFHALKQGAKSILVCTVDTDVVGYPCWCVLQFHCLPLLVGGFFRFYCLPLLVGGFCSSFAFPSLLVWQAFYKLNFVELLVI